MRSEGNPASGKSRRLSWKAKLSLLLLFFAAVPLCLMAFWLFDLFAHTYEASTIESLKALVGAKAESIEQFTDDRRHEVERIAQLVADEVVRAQDLASRSPSEAPLPELQDATKHEASQLAARALRSWRLPRAPRGLWSKTASTWRSASRALGGTDVDGNGSLVRHNNLAFAAETHRTPCL